MVAPTMFAINSSKLQFILTKNNINNKIKTNKFKGGNKKWEQRHLL